MKSMRKVYLPLVATVLAFSGVTAVARPSRALTEDKAQLASDKAALQREEKQLIADRAILTADKASGKMAAESPDSQRIYKERLNIKGEKKDIATDEAKMKADQKK
jgi:cell division protein FtsL